MSETIAKVEQNEGYLVNLLKNHTSVIDSTINLMKNTQESSKRSFEQITTSLSNVISKVNTIGYEDRFAKLNQIFSSISSQLTLLIINVQRVQSALIDVLTDTHHGKINSLLLTPEQVKDETTLINSHIPPELEIPVDSNSLLQLYKLMTVKGGLSNQKAIFYISLPLARQQQYTIFKMIPIPTIINNTLVGIDTCKDAFGINRHRDEYIPLDLHTLESCNVMDHNQYLCSHLQTRFTKLSDRCACEIGLFNNETQPICNVRKYATQSSWISLHNRNQWLFATTSPMRLTAVCEEDTFHIDINHSGLLTMEPGCSVRNNVITLEASQIYSNQIQTSYISLGNISELSIPEKVNNLLEQVNVRGFDKAIQELKNRHTEMQNELILLPNKLQPTRHFAIGYGVLIIITILALCIAWKKCKSTSSAAVPQPSPPQPAPRQRCASSAFNINIED